MDSNILNNFNNHLNKYSSVGEFRFACVALVFFATLDVTFVQFIICTGWFGLTERFGNTIPDVRFYCALLELDERAPVLVAHACDRRPVVTVAPVFVALALPAFQFALCVKKVKKVKKVKL